MCIRLIFKLEQLKNNSLLVRRYVLISFANVLELNKQKGTVNHLIKALYF